MPTYTILKIKNDISEKFRGFSRSTAMNQSELLELMINFFLRNKISPKEDLGPNMETLEATIKKRIGSVIAIIRAIEKSQTKPTFTMFFIAKRINSLHELKKRYLPRLKIH